MEKIEKDFLTDWIDDLKYDIDNDEIQLGLFKKNEIAFNLKKQMLNDVISINRHDVPDFRDKIHDQFDMAEIYESADYYRTEEHFQEVAEIQERIDLNKVVLDHIEKLID